MSGTNDEAARTLWCGSLHHKVTEELLYELFLQAGPLESVKIISDKGHGPNYAFIVFKHSVSVPYSLQLLNGIRLYDQPLRLKQRNGSGNTGGGTGSSAEQLPPPKPFVPPPPPQVTPPFLHAPQATLVPQQMRALNHISERHGLQRSHSEPERLGAGWRNSQKTGNVVQGHERTPASFGWSRGHHRPGSQVIAQNIVPQLLMVNRTYAAGHRSPMFDARWHGSSQKQPRHHQQFNDFGGPCRR